LLRLVGTPRIEALPLGERLALGVLQVRPTGPAGGHDPGYGADRDGSGYRRR
jgi:hypothetical protein